VKKNEIVDKHIITVCDNTIKSFQTDINRMLISRNKQTNALFSVMW